MLPIQPVTLCAGNKKLTAICSWSTVGLSGKKKNINVPLNSREGKMECVYPKVTLNLKLALYSICLYSILFEAFLSNTILKAALDEVCQEHVQVTFNPKLKKEKKVNTLFCSALVTYVTCTYRCKKSKLCIITFNNIKQNPIPNPNPIISTCC